ncbi:hypothetical protein Clacol_004379 [Clathrus columnatus]|uniref:Uncharacterized protein n=1 Tax=Clathrus columnatus TaxID=1419009 RepID=A0AAV5ABZ1_9AGAM|nr:hypothetical protein Clacol_004379 [Clathrus columnatus]
MDGTFQLSYILHTISGAMKMFQDAQELEDFLKDKDTSKINQSLSQALELVRARAAWSERRFVACIVSVALGAGKLRPRYVTGYIVGGKRRPAQGIRPLLVIPEGHPPIIYSTKPLKWILYATFAVLGVEGELMRYTEQDGACKEDLILDMEDQSPSERKLFYHPSSPIKFVDKEAFYSNYSYQTKDWQFDQTLKDNLVKRDNGGVDSYLGCTLRYRSECLP